ncbi:MAG TPA: hypothetical protein VFK15_06660 [Burkholderiales bacterium]|jgi:hypothetical protein|nr:hypothetical protein [Burkholderiales bacterium]
MTVEVTLQQLREMARAIRLDIPEADSENVRLRLSTLLAAMDEIERELGAEMDRTEPVPPVYPPESF